MAYINRELLIESLGKNSIIDKITYSDGMTIKEKIMKIPTADVEEVVRCKDCAGAIKHKEYFDMYKCNGCNFVRGRLVKGTFGCVVGKPKERTDT